MSGPVRIAAAPRWPKASGLAVLTALGALTAATFAGGGPARAQGCSGGLAETTICLLNEARAARGLQPLTPNAPLSAAARAHSADMVASQYFAFDSPSGSTPHQRARSAGYGGGAAGIAVTEAIAWGAGAEGTPQGTVQKWLDDPGARPVVLSASNTDIGVGVASGSPQGGLASSTTYTADLGRIVGGGGVLPVFGKSVAASPVQGIVLIQLPGGASRASATRFQPLSARRLLPVGSTLDTTRGRVRLVSSRGRGKGTQAAQLYDGIFKVSQRRSGRGLTEFRLGGPKPRCGSGARAAATRKRRLWAKGRGRFRTQGSYAAAAVRGTFWLTEDRCQGTFIRVRSGVLSVRDLRRKRTFTLRTGQSRLVRR